MNNFKKPLKNNNTVKIEGDYITGYSYPIKDHLKEAGVKWNNDHKKWCIDKYTDVVEVSKIINEFNEYNNELIKCGNNGCHKLKKRSFKTCWDCLNEIKEDENIITKKDEEVFLPLDTPRGVPPVFIKTKISKKNKN